MEATTTDMDRCIAELKAKGFSPSVTSGNDIPGHMVRIFADDTLVFLAYFGRDGREYGGRRDLLT